MWRDVFGLFWHYHSQSYQMQPDTLDQQGQGCNHGLEEKMWIDAVFEKVMMLQSGQGVIMSVLAG